MESLYEDVALPTLVSEKEEELSSLVSLLEVENASLQSSAELAAVKTRAAEETVAILERNISSLFTTAKLEVARKDSVIVLLRRAVDKERQAAALQQDALRAYLLQLHAVVKEFCAAFEAVPSPTAPQASPSSPVPQLSCSRWTPPQSAAVHRLAVLLDVSFGDPRVPTLPATDSSPATEEAPSYVSSVHKPTWEQPHSRRAEAGGGSSGAAAAGVPRGALLRDEGNSSAAISGPESSLQRPSPLHPNPAAGRGTAAAAAGSGGAAAASFNGDPRRGQGTSNSAPSGDRSGVWDARRGLGPNDRTPAPHYVAVSGSGAARSGPQREGASSNGTGSVADRAMGGRLSGGGGAEDGSSRAERTELDGNRRTGAAGPQRHPTTGSSSSAAPAVDGRRHAPYLEDNRISGGGTGGAPGARGSGRRDPGTATDAAAAPRARPNTYSRSRSRERSSAVSGAGARDSSSDRRADGGAAALESNRLSQRHRGNASSDSARPSEAAAGDGSGRRGRDDGGPPSSDAVRHRDGGRDGSVSTTAGSHGEHRHGDRQQHVPRPGQDGRDRDLPDKQSRRDADSDRDGSSRGYEASRSRETSDMQRRGYR